jgi:hypothetical protein
MSGGPALSAALGAWVIFAAVLYIYQFFPIASLIATALGLK